MYVGVVIILLRIFLVLWIRYLGCKRVCWMEFCSNESSVLEFLQAKLEVL